MSTTDVRPGATLKIEIEAIDESGSGTARVGDRTIAVPGAAPGDTVIAAIESVATHSDAAYARLHDVVARGTAYRKPPCHHAYPLRGKCGGCPLMHLSDDAQRAAKEAIVARALDGLTAGVALVPPPAALGYRNRGNFYLWRVGERVRFGSRQPRSDALARMDGCPVVAEPIADIAAHVVAVIERLGVPTAPGSVGVRGVCIRVDRQGAAAVELVCVPGPGWSPGNSLYDAVFEDRRVVAVGISEHDGQSNAVRMGPVRAVRGADALEPEFAGLQTRISYESFFQLNYAVAESIAGRVAEHVARLDASGGGRLWDLYCGAGTLGLVAASGRPVVGVESVAAAVEAARDTAERAGADAVFHAIDLRRGDLSELPTPSAVIADPPRKGLSETVREAIVTRGAPLVYVSCNPSTFARDVRALVGAGWRLDRVDAFDMLPQTAHVELVGVVVPPGS